MARIWLLAWLRKATVKCTSRLRSRDYYPALSKAEEKAKADKLMSGVWPRLQTMAEPSLPLPPAAASGQRKDAAGGGEDSGPLECTVTEIRPDLSFCVQLADDAERRTRLELEERRPAAVRSKERPPPCRVPTRLAKATCALFASNSAWQRARVLKSDSTGKTVSLIDLGLEKIINNVADIAQLPDSLRQAPPLARVCRLAFSQPPPDEEDIQLSVELMLDTVANKPATVRRVYESDGVAYVQLVEKASGVDVAELLLEKGLLFIDRRPPMGSKSGKGGELYSKYAAKQASMSATEFNLPSPKRRRLTDGGDNRDADDRKQQQATSDSKKSSESSSDQQLYTTTLPLRWSLLAPQFLRRVANCVRFRPSEVGQAAAAETAALHLIVRTTATNWRTASDHFNVPKFPIQRIESQQHKLERQLTLDTPAQAQPVLVDDIDSHTRSVQFQRVIISGDSDLASSAGVDEDVTESCSHLVWAMHGRRAGADGSRSPSVRREGSRSREAGADGSRSPSVRRRQQVAERAPMAAGTYVEAPAVSTRRWLLLLVVLALPYKFRSLLLREQMRHLQITCCSLRLSLITITHHITSQSTLSGQSA
uniref:Tudor domain-containing protein n=1 Tax=Macrostomum lignano TaxID=282301 RepID=A0A1I8FCR7_9PLAT